MFGRTTEAIGSMSSVMCASFRKPVLTAERAFGSWERHGCAYGTKQLCDACVGSHDDKCTGALQSCSCLRAELRMPSVHE